MITTKDSHSRNEAMEKSKHTPGPWEWTWQEGQPHEALRLIIYQETEESWDEIAEISDARRSNPQCEINANLLAAAPELLEALKCALPQLQWANLHGSRGEELLNQCKTAIAKAENK